MMTKEQMTEFLAQEWHKSGVNLGDCLLVHSSLGRIIKKSLAELQTQLTPEIVYQSLMEAIGPEGTLILPLFNFDFPQTGMFDIRHTPSQMGALTEVGRKAEGAVRTGHPIYSFAVRGKYAHKFASINNVSGYGADSPFAMLKELDGKIAVIGLTDQNSMTSYHYVEECNNVDYRYFKDFSGIYIDGEGESRPCSYRLFVRDVAKGVQTDVNRMMDYFWQHGYFKGFRPDEGYGMRTITMQDFYRETEAVIQRGEAISYLYSISPESEA